MKLLLTSDWHFTDKGPKNRTDDYPNTLIKKIKYILGKSAEYDNPILQAGDMTDTSLLSYSAYTTLLSLLKEGIKEQSIWTVYGQHDLLYRNKGNTPLDALEVACDPLRIVRTTIIFPNHEPDIYLYGCSFEEEIPEIQDPKAFNVLLIHKMIVDQHREEWEEVYPLAPTILKNSTFDLIVSGDNHKSFIVSTGGNKPRHLINCGSLMRSKIDQIHHKPFFCIFDTETRSYEKHYIPIQDWSEVFDLETKVKEEQKDEMLTSFVSSLSQHKEIGLSFQDNVANFMNENNIEQGVRDIVNWSMSS